MHIDWGTNKGRSDNRQSVHPLAHAKLYKICMEDHQKVSRFIELQILVSGV
jgi:hypothetical protein